MFYKKACVINNDKLFLFILVTNTLCIERSLFQLDILKGVVATSLRNMIHTSLLQNDMVLQLLIL